MIIHHGTSKFSVQKPVITIGMFDGVHKGHREVLKYVIDKAKQLNGESVVLTFWPHPRICFEGEKSKLRYLTTLNEKIKLLEETGLDHLVIQEFSKNFSTLSPEDYVKEVLVDGLGANTVIVGYDHNFGYKGQGDYDLLTQLSNKFDFSVKQLPAFSVEGVNVSSTKVRNAIHSGDIETANFYLSHQYTLSGVITNGNKIGRTIGFPTANIALQDNFKLVPRNGVYIISSEIHNKTVYGLLNIGNRPTVGDNLQKTIECFFLNFNEDIYKQEISIQLFHKIREELKFDSLEALKKQIAEDVSYGKTYLKQTMSDIS